MAHPHNEYRQSVVEKRRAHEMTRGYAKGGAVHADEREDKAMIKNMVKKTSLKADGGRVKARADRPARKKGGRVNHKGTTVNVITGHPGAPMAGLGGMAPPPGPVPMGPPPMAIPPRPMMPPPGAMPPGAPMMPPHKTGGRVYKNGGRVKRAMGGQIGYGSAMGSPPMAPPSGGIGMAAPPMTAPMTAPPGIGSPAIDPPMAPPSGVMGAPPMQTANLPPGLSGAFKRGGRVGVNVGSKVYEQSVKAGTHVSHDPGKNDFKDMNRPRVVTYKKGGAVKRASGGPIYAPEKGGMGPKFSGGAGGGRARIEKEERADKRYKAAK